MTTRRGASIRVLYGRYPSKRNLSRLGSEASVQVPGVTDLAVISLLSATERWGQDRSLATVNGRIHLDV